MMPVMMLSIISDRHKESVNRTNEPAKAGSLEREVVFR
jgi:hypothetical protein